MMVHLLKMIFQVICQILYHKRKKKNKMRMKMKRVENDVVNEWQQKKRNEWNMNGNDKN